MLLKKQRIFKDVTVIYFLFILLTVVMLSVILGIWFTYGLLKIGKFVIAEQIIKWFFLFY